MEKWRPRMADVKGGKPPLVTLAPELILHITLQLKAFKLIFQQDQLRDRDGMYLPGAFARKYLKAAFEWGWQTLLPVHIHSTDPRFGKKYHHYMTAHTIQ